MKSFNVVTGVPRSGSTLLCNILNQNPEFYAGDTSPLPEIVSTLVNKFSTNGEIQSALIKDSEGTMLKLNTMIQSVIEAWYEGEDRVIFDKSRGWTFNAVLLGELFSTAKIIATVRDLRNVFGSVEKQHRKTPVFDLASNPNEKTIMDRADKMMSPEGMIGQCVVGMEDAMARVQDRVFVVQYESFTLDPRSKMVELYDFLGQPYFEHDFEGVENVAEEVDGLYLNKFPHQGGGKVEKTDRNEWKEYITPELGGMIYQRYPQYNSLFGYQ